MYSLRYPSAEGRTGRRVSECPRLQGKWHHPVFVSRIVRLLGDENTAAVRTYPARATGGGEMTTDTTTASFVYDSSTAEFQQHIWDVYRTLRDQHPVYFD